MRAVLLALLLCSLVAWSGSLAKEQPARLLLWGSSEARSTRWLLVGALRGAQWLPAAAARRLVRSGESYQVYPSLATAATQRASQPVERVAGAFRGGKAFTGLDRTFVKVEGPRLRPGDFLAISGEPTALPRPAVLIRPLDWERKTLVTAHLTRKRVRPDQLRALAVRVDLDGDGKEELLLQGTALQKVGEGRGGRVFAAYSFLLEAGQVREQPRVLLEERHAESSDRFEDELLDVLDLDGDGSFELIYHHSHFESQLLEIYKRTGQRWRRVLRFDGGV